MQTNWHFGMTQAQHWVWFISCRMICVRVQEVRSSCLHVACRRNHKDIIRYLCDQGGKELLMQTEGVSDLRVCAVGCSVACILRRWVKLSGWNPRPVRQRFPGFCLHFSSIAHIWIMGPCVKFTCTHTYVYIVIIKYLYDQGGKKLLMHTKEVSGSFTLNQTYVWVPQWPRGGRLKMRASK